METDAAAVLARHKICTPVPLLVWLRRKTRVRPRKRQEESLLKALFALAATAAASSAVAADADNGSRLARSHCSVCHIVAPNERSEVAAAPPFDVIGRKYQFAADAIALAITEPHPRMNFSSRPADAADIAAYIGTLRR